MRSKWGYDTDFEALLEEGRLSLKDLLNKSILVTGATGLIGSVLIDLLLHIRASRKLQFEVTAASRDVAQIKNRFSYWDGEPYFHTVEYDLSEPLSDGAIGRHDYVIHCASVANPRWYVERPRDTITLNNSGVLNVLEYCKRHGSRFVYVSTVEVYGAVEGEVTENTFGSLDPMSVRSSYPESKRIAETMCAAYQGQYGLDVRVARPAKVYGPSNSPHDVRIMAHMLNETMQGRDISLSSSGKSRFAFCYVTDAASALLHILLNATPGEAYNIADKASISTLRSVAIGMASAAGVKAFFGEGAGTAVSEGAIIDAGKLEALGWSALTPLDAGITKQLEAVRYFQSLGSGNAKTR